MKKLLLCLFAPALILLQSCKEKEVVIDRGSKGKVTDTAYMAAVEKAQPRNVLIEEFTGASCANCPAGHQAIAGIISAHPGRIVTVAYHTYNGGRIFEPVNEGGHKSHYDFRDTAATDIATNTYNGVSAIPIGGVDRLTVSGSRQFNRTEWGGLTDARLPVATPVNLYLSSVYKPGNNEVTVSVKVVYTEVVSKKNNLTIAVTESGIIDAQISGTTVVAEYEHNHVLRRLLTPQFYGVRILDENSKAAGQVYEYTYTFAPDAAWNLDNCGIIAFVSNNEGEDQEVLQAAEVHLK